MATQFAYEVEKNVPVPTGRATKYPFDDMDIGDSFLAEESFAVRRAVAAHAQRHNRKFTCRKVGDGQMRVWRIA